MPIVVESSRLATDSGGAGTTRGGLSMQRRMRVMAAEASYSLLSDGAVLPAFGVVGGQSGLPVGAWAERNGEISPFDTPGKIAGHKVPQGSSIIIRSAGGGGYGDPLARDLARVAQDLHDGYISGEAARDVYGLVLTDGGEVNGAASEARRKALANDRIKLTIVPNQGDDFEVGAYSKRRVFRVNAADAERLGVAEDDLAEIDAGHAAPLRGWIRIDASTLQGFLPLATEGAEILKVAAGQLVQLRRIPSVEAAPRQLG